MARHHRPLIPVLVLALALALFVTTVGGDWNGNLVGLLLIVVLAPAVGWSVRRPGEPVAGKRHGGRPFGAYGKPWATGDKVTSRQPGSCGQVAR